MMAKAPLCMHVQGKSTGTNIPVDINQVSSLTARTTVSVVNTPVCLTKISVVAYTGASWLSPPASISPLGSTTAQLMPLQVTLLQTALQSCVFLTLLHQNVSVIDVIQRQACLTRCNVSDLSMLSLSDVIIVSLHAVLLCCNQSHMLQASIVSLAYL